MMPPEIPQPPILARLARFVAPRPTLAATCTAIAHEFETLAREAYLDGDDARGDRLWERQLAWNLAAITGDLGDVKP